MSVNKEQKASVLYLFATLFNKGIAFLTVPVFTRLLSTSDYGIVTTYNSWVDILTVVLSLALYMAIRTSFVDFKDETMKFLNTVITFTLLISTMFGIIAILVVYFVEGANLIFVFWAVIQGASSALLLDYTQYLMMDFKYVKRALYISLPNFLGVLFSLLVIFLFPSSNRYLGRIVPTMLVYLVFGFFVLFKIYSKQKPKLNKEHLRYGLSISLPLVFHGIALNILSQSDRTMITLIAGASQTGIYSLVYNFGMIATVLTTALEGVWIPWFMIKINEKNINEINTKASDYIKLMTCAMSALILVGPEILKFLADPTYWEGVSIIPPVILSNYFIFAYTFYVNIEHYYKKTIGITINTIIAAITNIALNFVLIPKYGYIAASYTTLVAYIIALLLHARCSRKIEKTAYPLRIFAGPFFLILFSVIIYYLFINQWYLRWLIMVIILIVIITKERNKILLYIGVDRKRIKL